jgi:phosphatidylglycerophosphatase A
MNISVFFSTLFGVGYFPKAPGTAGTLLAAAVYFLLPDRWFGNGFYVLGCVLFLSLMSVFVISKTEKRLGHDSKKIVLDEFFGFFFAVIFLPKTLFVIIMVFFLFRFFDILKPVPVNILQNLPGGWGVMADDVMAGIYTNIFLQVLVRIFPNLIR